MSDLVQPYCMLADPARADWAQPSPLPSLALCGEPAIAAVTFACVHEHVDTVSACAGCAAEIQRVIDEMICRQCLDSAAPHECEQLIRIRWLEGSKP